MKRSITFLILFLLFIPNIVYAKKYKCTYVSRDSISNCSRNKNPDKCDVDITPFLNQAVTIIFDEDKLVDNYEMEINIKGTNFQSKYNIFNVAHTAAGGLHNFIDSYSDTHDDFSTFCGDSISTLYFACGLSTTYNCYIDTVTDSIWNTYVEESFYGSFAYKQGSQVEAGADDKGDNAALGLLDGEHVSTEEILDAKGQEDPRKPSGGKTSSDNRDLTGGFTFGGGNCHAISRINEIMEDYINIPLKAVAILLLVGLTIVDFVKNIGDKEADPKKPFNKLIKRSIACAILFFAKEIVEVIIKLAGTTGAC